MDPQNLPSNPQDDARPQIVGVTAALTALAVVTVGLRLWVRLRVIKSFGADDVIMVVSTALMMALQAVIIVEVKNGHGRHIGDVPPERYMVGMKYNFISQPLAFVVTNFIKLSVGAALLRIAVTRFWKILIWTVIGVMVFYTIGALFTIILQCQPVEMQWDPSVKGSCWAPITLQALAYTSIVLNIITDLMFAVFIPLPMLWSLNLNRRVKMALLFVLSLGILACVAAAVRLSYIARYGIRIDYLWDTAPITIWYVVEATVGIIAGSLPSLKPLFKSVIGTTKRYGSSKTPNYQSGATPSQKSTPVWKFSRGSKHAFSTAERDDDNESERGLNVARSNTDAYALHPYPKTANTCVATAERELHLEGNHGVPNQDEEGIVKTRTTTLSFLNR